MSVYISNRFYVITLLQRNFFDFALCITTNSERQNMKTRTTVLLLTAAAVLLTSCGIWSASPDESFPGERSEAVSDEITPEELSDESSAEAGYLSEVPNDEKSNQSSVPVGIDDGQFVYYAFGDSIAAGYALENPSDMCYAALFASRFAPIKYKNYAVSGHKTSDMLGVLESVDVSEADLVTMSIGANNLLGHAIEALYGVLDKYGYSIFQDYLSALMGNDGKENVISFIKDVEVAFTGEEFQAKAQSGLDALNAELPSIIQKIRGQNEKCIIVIQTIYNPYRGLTLGLPGEYIFDLSAACDGYLKRYNDAITSVAGEYGCELLDVYADFNAAGEDYINAGISVVPSFSFSYDPHPNAAGHAEIADMLYNKWNEILMSYE